MLRCLPSISLLLFFSDEKKRDIIWKELADINPKHPFARKAQLLKPQTQETAKTVTPPENASTNETMSEPRIKN